MKINALSANSIVLKFMPGAVIFITFGGTFNNTAVASSLIMQEKNSYNLEELSYFSLKLDRDIYNQLEKEILKQESDFSDYIKLIDSGLRLPRYRLQAEPTLNILVQSEKNREETSFLSFVDSLKKIEFQAFAVNPSSQTSVPVLPQVNYRNVYKDVYDFSINSTNSSQKKTSVSRVPRTIVRTQQLPEDKYFSSSFIRKKSPSYPSYKSQPSNINNNNFYTNNTNSSLLAPSQKRPVLDSLTSSPVAGLSLVNNTSQSRLGRFTAQLALDVGDTPFQENIIADINGQTYDQNYLKRNDDDFQITDKIQPVYLPSTNMEIYQISKIDIPSLLSSYKKPEYQEELDKDIQKKEKEIQKQRQELSKKLAKLKKEREHNRKKELANYRKQRQQQLVKAMKNQQRLQEQRQRQFKY